MMFRFKIRWHLLAQLEHDAHYVENSVSFELLQQNKIAELDKIIEELQKELGLTPTLSDLKNSNY